MASAATLAASRALDEFFGLQADQAADWDAAVAAWQTAKAFIESAQPSQGMESAQSSLANGLPDQPGDLEVMVEW